jgi:chemotaxis signal transduction protein
MPSNRSPSFNQAVSARRITAFTAVPQGEGVKLMIAGWLQMQPARNMPQYVRGTIRMESENIPIVDLAAKSGSTPKQLTDNACVVLHERKSEGKTVTTGTLYEDVTDLLRSFQDKLKPQTPSNS